MEKKFAVVQKFWREPSRRKSNVLRASGEKFLSGVFVTTQICISTPPLGQGLAATPPPLHPFLFRPLKFLMTAAEDQLEF